MRIRPLIALLLVAFAVLPACSDGVSPGSEYPYWERTTSGKATGEVRHFTVKRNGLEYLHALTISGDGKLNDEQSDATAQLLARRNGIILRENGELSGCTDHTLWHLPTELRLEGKLMSVPGPTVISSSILCLDAANLIAGSRAEGLFHYNVSRGEWYTMLFPGRGEITALCKDSTQGNVLLFVRDRHRWRVLQGSAMTASGKAPRSFRRREQSRNLRSEIFLQ